MTSDPIQMAPASPTDTAVSATGTITFLALLIGLALCGFGYMSVLRADIEYTLGEMQKRQSARHAMLQAGDAVASALVAGNERPDLSAYNAAIARLGGQTERDFPAMAKVDGLATPALPLFETLTSAWADIIPMIHRGDFDAARAVFVRRDVPGKIGGLDLAFQEDVTALERSFGELDRQHDLVVRVVLGLVVLSGLFCIAAFVVVTRRGRREAAVRARAVAAANASREQVARLFEMTDMLQSAADHVDANAVLRATAADLIPGFGGALYVFSNSRDRLALSTTWNREGHPELPDTIGLQHCWSLKRGKPHVNVPNSRKLSCQHFTGEDCVLEIPMIARGEILGLLQIHAAAGADGEARLAEVQGLGSALADGMSLALANIALRDQLRSQALRDPLTNLYNRRYMEDALLRLAGLAEREKTELSVIMIDLDHFKRLNDNHGHAKGDAVLRDAAAILLNQVRETDIACRYGGEELIVVLPGCGLEKATAKAEQMRVAIEAMSEPNGVQVSASMGVATIPSTSVAPRDLLATADAALYVAKQGGRNRVSTAARLDAGAGRVVELVAAE